MRHEPLSRCSFLYPCPRSRIPAALRPPRPPSYMANELTFQPSDILLISYLPWPHGRMPAGRFGRPGLATIWFRQLAWLAGVVVGQPFVFLEPVEGNRLSTGSAPFVTKRAPWHQAFRRTGGTVTVLFTPSCTTSESALAGRRPSC